MDILLVDDNPDFLSLMSDLLFEKGYSVTTASDGMEAIDVLNTSDVDLIISDIKMPRLDGIKLHAFAREMQEYKDTKFIFISGYKEMYSDILTLNPALDFMFDKTAPVQEVLQFVDELMFGNFVGTWV